MISLSHPTGNAFVRALLAGLEDAQIDYSYFTTMAFDGSGWWRPLLPASVHGELARRSDPAPPARCRQRPLREVGRLLCQRLGLRRLVQHETGWFSVDAVYRDLDRFVARQLPRARATTELEAVYAYEDGAHETFRAARACGIRCCYELPIAYWETSRRLLREEAARWPEWEPTLLATRDSTEKRERKTRELEWADVVVCPSQFVFRSLPEAVRQTKRCVVAEFGSPVSERAGGERRGKADSPLRVLFAGAMTQRKGLADVLAAMRQLRRSDVELVILGTPLQPMEFYRRQFPFFRYEPPRGHAGVMAVMATCDVLVLPSMVEGRALVQQEALSCGLPLIVTPNAGGEELIETGRTGFLIPIRSPEAIAEKIAWFADHREALPAMREWAQAKAAQFTWQGYVRKILDAIGPGSGAVDHPAPRRIAA